MSPRLLLMLAALGTAFASAKEDHDHGEHEHGGGEGTARFEEGLGLELALETSEALGLTIEPAQVRSLAPRFEVTATVFESGPPARAVSFHTPETVASWRVLTGALPRIQKISTSLQNALGQQEVIWELAGAPAPGSTVTFTFRGPERTTIAVPERALLRTATGTFVYVQKAGYFLLTPVRLGGTGDSFVEILEGLAEGAPVVVDGAETLWLTELRLTKGGGHSH